MNCFIKSGRQYHDAIKEGDGDRLFDIYKIALLLYKAHGHFKYAYVVTAALSQMHLYTTRKAGSSC